MENRFFIRKAFWTLLTIVMLITVIPMRTLVASASTNSYTYNAELAIAFAASHCSSESQLAKDVCDEDWLCAEFVANCLTAGGFNISGYTATVNAKAQGEYMQQYGIKMSGNITGKAIHDNDFVLPLKKGDVVYIVYDETVSASGHVLLYSGEKDSNGNLLFYAHNSRKEKETYSVTGKYLEAATEMYAIILEDSNEQKAFNNSTYSAQDFVDAALDKVGTTFADGYCLRFVAQVFQATYGGNYISSCCAYKHGNSYIDSNLKNNIPLGACVFFGGSSKTCNTCANKCGHIGIYVGDGYIVHGWGGKIVKTTIDYVINSNYPYRGWGWQGNIALDCTDVVINSTNPDNYPECERDLIYNSTVEKGDDVKWVQCILKHLGYSIDIDGSYGPSSRDTIKKFQTAYGLTVDGQTGPKTRAKLKEVWASKGHTWDSGTVVTAATHTTTGVKTYKCNYCEATKNETVAKLYGCTYGAWQNLNATQHKRTCACGLYETASHTWNTGVVTKQPTCTVEGVKTYTCTGCNATKTEAIPPKGHSYGVWQNYNGTQHKRSCTCGVFETANHTWNSGTVTKPAAHTEQGVKTYTCTGCGALKTESIPIIPHVYGAWQKHNASQHKRVCSCGSVEYVNHTESGIITDSNATCSSNGKWHTECLVCREIIKDGTSPMLKHTEVIDESVQPTCKTTGLTEGKHCSACGAVTVYQEILPIISHDLGEWKETIAPTCTEKGEQTRKCVNCDYHETQELPQIGHRYQKNTIEPSCTEQGWIENICICGDAYNSDFVNPTGHIYDSDLDKICNSCGYEREINSAISSNSQSSSANTETSKSNNDTIVTDSSNNISSSSSEIKNSTNKSSVSANNDKLKDSAQQSGCSSKIEAKDSIFGVFILSIIMLILLKKQKAK